MNQRITELARQSGCDVLYDYDMDGHGLLLSAKDTEKFAELIVRECASKCVNAYDARTIEKHFGVEE